MKNNKKSKSPIVIALYVLAAIFAIYTVISMYNSYSYITTLVAQGLVISEELLNVISYFVENSAPYIFYAVATWAIGYIISKVNYISNNIKVETEEQVEDIIIEESNDVVSSEEEVEAIEEEIVTSDEDNNTDENNM